MLPACVTRATAAATRASQASSVSGPGAGAGSASRSALIGCHSFAVSSESPRLRLDGVELRAHLVRTGDRLVELRGGRLVADRLADGGGARVGEGVDQLQRRHDVVDAVDLLGGEGDLRVLLLAERLSDVRDRAHQQQARPAGTSARRGGGRQAPRQARRSRGRESWRHARRCAGPSGFAWQPLSASCDCHVSATTGRSAGVPGRRAQPGRVQRSRRAVRCATRVPPVVVVPYRQMSREGEDRIPAARRSACPYGD